jgi:hypothetical protein
MAAYNLIRLPKLLAAPTCQQGGEVLFRPIIRPRAGPLEEEGAVVIGFHGGTR